MEKAELIERIEGYEWNDIEFKRAQRCVPDTAYETVSAFSNTEGGWFVFGIRDGAAGYETVDVLEVDKVQNDFLSVLRSGQKLNRVIAVDEWAILERLAVQGFVSPLGGVETPAFGVAEHLAGRLGRTAQGGDQVDLGPSGLVTDQVDIKPGGLVTGQARSGQEDLSTAQADRPSGSLFTAQAESLRCVASRQ